MLEVPVRAVGDPGPGELPDEGGDVGLVEGLVVVLAGSLPVALVASMVMSSLPIGVPETLTAPEPKGAPGPLQRCLTGWVC